MISKFHLPDDPGLASQLVANESRHQELSFEVGVLGKFFGTGKNAPVYIVALITTLLVTAGIVYTFWGKESQGFSVKEYWTFVSPIVTTMIGFLFGRSTNGAAR